MNSLMMIMLMSGGRMGAQFGQQYVAMRRQSFEKWRAFLLFLETLLVQGFFFWRGVKQFTVGNVQVPPGATLDTIMYSVQWGQQDALTQWFIRDVVKQGFILLLELIKPSALEESLMASLLGG